MGFCGIPFSAALRTTIACRLLLRCAGQDKRPRGARSELTRTHPSPPPRPPLLAAGAVREGARAAPRWRAGGRASPAAVRLAWQLALTASGPESRVGRRPLARAKRRPRDGGGGRRRGAAAHILQGAPHGGSPAQRKKEKEAPSSLCSAAVRRGATARDAKERVVRHPCLPACVAPPTHAPNARPLLPAPPESTPPRHSRSKRD